MAWFSCYGSSVAAQTAATLGMTASFVEYEGFLASGAATLTTALRVDRPSFAIGGQGSWTVFESGNPILQTTGAAAWLTPLRERWGIELSGTAGAFRYADEPAAGHFLARGRVHFFADRSGGWVGASTGASFDGSAETPVEFAIGAWSVNERFAVVGTLTGTWLGTNRHVDLTGAAKWTGSRLELEARAGARPWVISDGEVGDALTGVWGELSALVPLATRISLDLSAGSYPSDPVRRVLGAKYATAGLRLAVARSNRSPILTIPAAMVAAVQKHANAASTLGARLEIAPTGQLRAFRVHVAGATSVELMGDFTDWRTVALTRVGDGIWEIQLELAPGVHRLNVRIDGGEWLVPAGARPEQGEFGGVVGVVVVR